MTLLLGTPLPEAIKTTGEKHDVMNTELFGFEAEVLEVQCLSDLIKQLRWLRLGHGNLMDSTEMEGTIHELSNG